MNANPTPESPRLSFSLRALLTATVIVALIFALIYSKGEWFRGNGRYQVITITDPDAYIGHRLLLVDTKTGRVWQSEPNAQWNEIGPKGLR